MKTLFTALAVATLAVPAFAATDSADAAQATLANQELTVPAGTDFTEPDTATRDEQLEAIAILEKLVQDHIHATEPPADSQ